MGIEVLKGGMLSSIQDQGRFGHAKYGVPNSGVLDSYSANFANLLLGNEQNAAVLEVTLMGPKLLFHKNTWAAVAGISAEIELNNQSIPINEAFPIKKGDMLNLKRVEKGRCIYLAVSGGIQSEKVLGSRSMYESITDSVKINKGDVLPISEFHKKAVETHSSVRFDEERYKDEVLKVFPGPEFDQLEEEEKHKLMGSTFSLSKDCNRMAFPMLEKVENKFGNMLSVPVLPGTVQLTPSGRLIVLMKDCQVSGGYPRVLQLSENSLDILGQRRAGEKVRFKI